MSTLRGDSMNGKNNFSQMVGVISFVMAKISESKGVMGTTRHSRIVPYSTLFLLNLISFLFI
jgi:hypothetical protein